MKQQRIFFGVGMGVVLFVAVLLVWTSLSGNTLDASPGVSVFSDHCASCHGVELEGGSGPNLAQIGARMSEEEIADIVTNGRGSMEAGHAGGKEVGEVASWLAKKQ